MDDMARLAAGYLGGHPIEDPIVSPLRADLSGLPPILVQAAADDRARPEADALAARLADHGVDCRFEIYASDAHVFHVFWSFLPEARAALDSAGEFVAGLLLPTARSAHPGR
jgi:acetyl esterase/lipase